jgi:hypothetical protein
MESQSYFDDMWLFGFHGGVSWSRRAQLGLPRRAAPMSESLVRDWTPTLIEHSPVARGQVQRRPLDRRPPFVITGCELAARFAAVPAGDDVEELAIVDVDDLSRPALGADPALPAGQVPSRPSPTRVPNRSGSSSVGFRRPQPCPSRCASRYPNWQRPQPRSGRGGQPSASPTLAARAVSAHQADAISACCSLPVRRHTGQRECCLCQASRAGRPNTDVSVTVDQQTTSVPDPIVGARQRMRSPGHRAVAIRGTCSGVSYLRLDATRTTLDCRPPLARHNG